MYTDYLQLVLGVVGTGARVLRFGGASWRGASDVQIIANAAERDELAAAARFLRSMS